MAKAVIMPKQGQSVESCIIAKWHKHKGDKVNIGDVLFSYETDKATFDEEAKVEGTLLDIFFEEGDDVPCLLNMCVIGNEGESTQELNPNGQSALESASSPAPEHEAIQAAAPETPVAAYPVASLENDGKIKISPRAKNLAEKTGVDYQYATPSGPYGRIIEKDIVALRESGLIVTSSAREDYFKLGADQTVSGTGLGGRITTADLNNIVSEAPVSAAARDQASKAKVEEVKLSNIRKVIAKALFHSISTTCQLTLNSSFDATDILEFRKKLKEGKERLDLENITINDIILYAVSRTLLNYRELNAHYLDDKMLYFNNVHLGLACDTERGLLVPNVFNANLKSLNEISKEAKKLIQECQKGTISPDYLKDGSFTVTNLGTLDVESFTPVLNAPQTGILGVCGIVQRVKKVDGEIVGYPAMGLSLTFDHRALDGAPAARFLKELKINLENFSVMLVK
jgi:pyruvate dehydrogenase E2 component (dihydrolipoamide acetyltransferase)